jgi:hypothetical protein
MVDTGARRSPQGFTQAPEIRAILRPHEDSAQGDRGGIVRFDGLPGEDLRRLLPLLPDWQAQVAQNESPTLAEFAALGEQYPRLVFFGYRVLPERSDERITVEGFRAEGLSAEEARRLSEVGGRADEWEVLEDNATGTWQVYAWWD